MMMVIHVMMISDTRDDDGDTRDDDGDTRDDDQ